MPKKNPHHFFLNDVRIFSVFSNETKIYIVISIMVLEKENKENKRKQINVFPLLLTKKKNEP